MTLITRRKSNKENNKVSAMIVIMSEFLVNKKLEC